jgi:hypothetical protein
MGQRCHISWQSSGVVSGVVDDAANDCHDFLPFLNNRPHFGFNQWICVSD